MMAEPATKSTTEFYALEKTGIVRYAEKGCAVGVMVDSGRLRLVVHDAATDEIFYHDVPDAPFWKAWRKTKCELSPK